MSKSASGSTATPECQVASSDAEQNLRNTSAACTQRCREIHISFDVQAKERLKEARDTFTVLNNCGQWMQSRVDPERRRRSEPAEAAAEDEDDTVLCIMLPVTHSR